MIKKKPIKIKSKAAIIDLLNDFEDIDIPRDEQDTVSPITTPSGLQTATISRKNADSIATIATNRCVPWKYADRSEDEMGDLDSLSHSISKYGQQEPILVRQISKSENSSIEFEIIFGHRRWRACSLINKPLKAMVREITDQQAAIAQKEENGNREDISDYSKAIYYTKLLDNDVFANQNELARELGIGRTTLTDLLSYSRIPSSILKVIPNPHKLKKLYAVRIAKLSQNADEKTLEALKDIIFRAVAGKITVRSIEPELRLALAGNIKTDKPLSPEKYISAKRRKNGDIAIHISEPHIFGIEIKAVRTLLEDFLNNQEIKK